MRSHPGPLCLGLFGRGERQGAALKLDGHVLGICAPAHTEAAAQARHTALGRHTGPISCPLQETVQMRHTDREGPTPVFLSKIPIKAIDNAHLL